MTGGWNLWSRDRIAVAVHFAMLGLVCSAWASSIDDLKALLGATDTQLGMLLFSGPVGNLVSFAFAGRLIRRLGSRRSLRIACLCYLAGAFLLACDFMFRAPFALWCFSVAWFGMTGNIFNISVNTQAGIVEKRAGRQIMNTFHAMFSVAMLAGSILTLAASVLSVPVSWRFFLSVLLAAAAHLVSVHALPGGDAEPRTSAGSRRLRPDRSLLALGLAAMVIMGCEGSIGDWVCVYYRDSLGAVGGSVKWGFCAVMSMMVVGRLVTDGLVNRFSARTVFHVYSVLTASGLGIALSSPYMGIGGTALLAVATAGYGIAGYGISGLVPILYSKGNRAKCMPPASALTFIGSMGFLGYFLGPPLIGRVADLASLSAALGIFAALMLFCLFIDPDSE
ncbi:MAG: MFS transporter [Kiritimatiellae bacterium]|nr:MFS transporter [Kiritimatiellia bacterium]